MIKAEAEGLASPASSCREHPDSIHFHVSEVSSERAYGMYYTLSGYREETYLPKGLFVDDIRLNKWYYAVEAGEAIGFYLCSGTHVAPSASPSEDKHEEDKHESRSNDDDSRPAPPTPHQSAQASILSSVDTQLAAIASTNGQVKVDGKDLVNSLPNATMKKIAENPNAIVYFTYTYNDAKYTTAIPGKDIDTSVEWYGPMYMMTHFPTMWHQDANTSVPVVAPVQ